MKRKAQKTLSALLAFVMLLGMLPTAAFAAGSATVTLTANYKGTANLAEVEASDETPIEIAVTVNKPNETGYSLELALPLGVELDRAGGSTTNYPPGVGEIPTSGNSVTTEAPTGTFFTGAPTWTPNVLPQHTYTTAKMDDASGTLTYDLASPTVVNFTFHVKVNRNFVPMANDAQLKTLLGSITATVKKGGVTGATASIPVTAVAQPAEVHFENLVAEEYAGKSLLGLSQDNLIEDNVDGVVLSTRLVINAPFDGYKIESGVNKPQFTITLPAGATAVGNTNYVVTKITGAVDNDWLVTINNTNQGITFLGNKNYINMEDCILVDLDGSSATVKDLTVGDSFPFTVKDIYFRLRDGKLNAAGTKFESIQYTSPAGHANKTMTTSIDVEAFAPNYKVGQADFSSTKHNKNNYYDFDAVNVPFATYWDKIETTEKGIQELMAIRRIFDSTTLAANEENVTVDPVRFSMVANQVEYESGKFAYLDFVTAVNLQIPFLGNAPRQSVKLVDLEIKTEAYDRTSGSAVYPYTDTTKGVSGIKTYTFSQSDIDAFMATITGHETQIGSSYDFATGTPIGTSGIVSYGWNTGKHPLFFVEAPENESIISVVATFTGDTSAFSDTTAGTYSNKVLGYPKSPEITYDKSLGETYTANGIKSSYTYTIAQDLDKDGTWQPVTDVRAASCPFAVNGGFVWEAPVTFDLDVDGSNENLTYMYSATEAGFVSGGYDPGKGGFGLKGYQNLASVSLKNITGALPKQPITASATIDPTNGDVVKEIFFPYIENFSKITAMTYTLFEHKDADSDGVLEYVLVEEGGATKIYDGLLDDYTLASNQGVLVAPDGYSFASFSITLEGWTNVPATAATTSTLALHGYLKDSDELITGDVADAYTFTVITETMTQNVTNSDTKFQTNTASYAATRVLDTIGIPIGMEPGNRDCNTLMPGVETDVSVMVFGGKSANPYTSAWHDITFTIALPSTIILEDLTLGNHHLEFNAGVPGYPVDETAIATGETVEKRGYETPVEQLNVDVGSHFDDAKLSATTSANIYTYTLSNEDLALYWTRHATSNTENHTTFTITMTLKAENTAADIAVPWSDILILGTNDSKITTFGTFANGTDYTGAAVDAFTGNLQTGVTSKNVVGDDDAFLYVKQTPMVLVHDAHIEKGSEEYYYTEGNNTSLAAFTKGETGTLHFSVMDTVGDGVSGTNYVLMPLPTLTTTNALQTKADFAVTLKERSGTYVTVTDNSGAAVYSVKYVTMPGDIANLTFAQIQALTSDTTYNASTHNAILLEITSQKQFEALDVEVDFTVPDTVANTAQTVTLSAMTAYNLTSGTNRYFAGTAPTGTAAQDKGNNFVSFTYQHPEHAITYNQVLVNVDDTQTTTAYTGLTPAKVENNGTLAEPADPTAVLGYTFVDWYSNQRLTKVYGATTITAPTTIYAKFAEKTGYSVEYVYEAGFTATPPADSIDLNWHEAVTLHAPADRAGYSFLGWYDAGNNKVAVGATMADLCGSDDTVRTITLTGKYAATQYEVAYDVNGGTGTIANQTGLTWDDAFTLTTAVPTPATGYLFDGWYTAPMGGIKVTDTDPYSATPFAHDGTTYTTLYAQYTLKDYTISFVSGATGVTAPADITGVKWTDTVPPLATLTQMGYQFLGWKNGANYVFAGDAYSSATGNVDGNLTLTGTWAPEDYDLTLNHQDGVTPDSTMAFTWGTAQTLPTPTRRGYTFDGWNTLSDGTGTSFPAGSTQYEAINTAFGDATAAHRTLYARWTPITFTIDFNYTEIVDGNNVAGTGVASKTVAWDADIALVAATISSAYHFVNWQYDSKAVPLTGTFGDVFGALVSSADYTNQSITLNANYDENIVTIHYHIPFDANGFMTTGNQRWQSLPQGAPDAITLTHPQKDGYTFMGWYTDAACTPGNEVASGVISIIFANHADGDANDLYAKYTENQYDVTYEMNDSTTTDFTTQNNYKWVDTFAFPPTHPTYAGHTFTGWYRNGDGKTDKVTEGKTYGTTMGGTDVGSQTLYAGWTVNHCTVRYDLAGGTGIVPAQTDLTWTTAITAVTNPTRDGYDFIGWNIDPTATTAGTYVTYADTGAADVDGTVATLTAIWEAKTYDVAYDEQGGAETMTDTTCAFDGTFTVTTESITQAGKTFAGWYTQADGKGALITSGTYGDLFGADHVTLYAGWSDKPYQITFDGNGASTNATDDGYWEHTVELPSEPIRLGYTFQGWYNGSVHITAGATFASIIKNESVASVTLTAKWQAKTYQVTYDAKGGTAVGGSAFTYDGDYTLPTQPTLSHNHFDGWYVNTNYSGTAVTAGKYCDLFGATNVMLTAKWSPKTYTVSYDQTAGQGVLADTTVQYNGIFTLNTDKPTRKGYTLASWNTQRDGNGVAVDNTTQFDSTFADADLTLYAQWAPVDYTLSFDLVYTTTGAPADMTVDWETDVTLPTVSRSGYTFNGWYLDAADPTTKVESGIYGDEIDKAADTTLYATWTKRPTPPPSMGGGTPTLETENHFAYMQGGPDGNFYPTANMTRAEAIVMFSRILCEGMDHDKTNSNSFADVTDQWYANEVGYMEQYGIIKGFEDGTFRGDAPITRAEFATVASRFDDLVANGNHPFSDVEDGYWAAAYINSANAKGWITGYENGTFCPTQNITRAEAVTLVNRVLGRYADEAYVDAHVDELKTFPDLASTNWAYYHILEAANGHQYTKSDNVETWISLD